MQKLAIKLFSVVSLFSLSSMVFAGTVSTTVTIHFAPPEAASVPTITTPMLLVLSLLLAVISYRMFKNSEFSKFTSFAIIGAAVAASGLGSFQLINDAHATGVGVFLSDNGSKTSGSIGNGSVFGIDNQTGVVQEVTDIVMSNAKLCSVRPSSDCKVGSVMGVSSNTRCDVSVQCGEI